MIPLYSHRNIQVRFTDAVATIGLDREGARQVLDLISKEYEYPQVANARFILPSLEGGRLPYQA